MSKGRRNHNQDVKKKQTPIFNKRKKTINFWSQVTGKNTKEIIPTTKEFKYFNFWVENVNNANIKIK